jgi:hypothetical protein
MIRQRFANCVPRTIRNIPLDLSSQHLLSHEGNTLVQRVRCSEERSIQREGVTYIHLPAISVCLQGIRFVSRSYKSQTKVYYSQ